MKIKVPKRYNYIEAYLTLRCNLNCNYCINKDSGVEMNRKELTGEEWIEVFNRLQTSLPITLGGGEPTLHKDFFKIVNKTKHKFDLLTNLQFDINKFIRNVNPNRFFTSPIPFYHPIRDRGFNIGLFGVTDPHFINDHMEMTFLSQKKGIFFYTKDFLGKFYGQTFGYFKYPKGVDGIPKQARCRTNELLIAPDGLVYRCHFDLYHNKNPIGNIKDKDFEINDIFRPCSNYGNCNPCDVKAKTNRFLKDIDCQVEIKNG